MIVGGLPAEVIAERFGTPTLAIDLEILDASIASVIAAADRHRVGVSYAGKVLLLVALARRLAALPIGLDVASLGEVVTAERGGIPAARMTLHGAGKSDEEIEAAFAGRVGRVAVDSIDELRRLAELGQGRALDVLLRINTGIEAHTHDFVRTAGDDSKFGLAPRDEATAFDLLRSTPGLRVLGVHAHVGSQVFDADPFVANVRALLQALERCRCAGFSQADTIVAGGGFGVPMHPEAHDERLDFEDLLATLAREMRGGVRFEIEPGRAIVATAGTSLYRVLAIKRYDRRTFVIVDGSMADNPRPALYGAYHHVVALRVSDAGHHEVTVCGRSCENDELATAALPRDLHAGDVLAVCTTGAYTYSMASNYNRFARPAVVAVGRGAAEMWARRERTDDILRCDVD